VRPAFQNRRRRLLTGLIVVLAGALTVFGLPGMAAAAPVAGSPGQASGKVSVSALCGTPKKGQAACMSLRRDDIAATKGVRPAATVAGFGPADLGAAYQLPGNGGAGATVGIVDAFSAPNAEADLAVYRAQFGLPACNVANGCLRILDQRGGTNLPPSDDGWAGEISLDLDMVSAVAPAAHILLIEADSPNFTDLGAAVNEAVALGAQYVSNSYGTGYSSTPGSGEDPSETTSLDQYYNHPGVAVVASSGDGNYGVSYPAASQYVTAVGGTSLVKDSSTRGWTESVWHNSFGGPGSGCSLYESKPAFQTDTGCAKRTEADVSAVADPVTGVAVYDSFGTGGGWGVYGGTSASSPIIAGVYAVAGTPAAGSYPNSYPYSHPTALNDVTTGTNGTCSPTYLCTAGAGYDGPTGLGTPAGLTAFSSGPHGDIAGTVTSSAGQPVAGAAITAHSTGGDGSTQTDSAGHYDLVVPPGTYDVTAAAYGYGSVTATGVAVVEGGSLTQNFTLTAVPTATLSGTVTDGSGHGWPLYAKVTVAGVPGGPVYTDPATGHYSLQLPTGQAYQLQVTANYPGYQSVGGSVTVSGDQVANFAVPVDVAACDAPGYQADFAGNRQTFDTTSTPAGWTVTNNTASGGWEFDDPGARGNRTGGTGDFAIIDSDHLGPGNSQDTTLTSPLIDVTTLTNPVFSFDTDYKPYGNSVADASISIDGGAYTSVWHHTTDAVTGPTHVELPLSVAGNSTVQLKFSYTGTWAYWWELDNVFVGTRTCDAVHGGLLLGQVTDGNTQAALNGATVTVGTGTATATSAATPADPNLGDGFYWLFSPATGAQSVSAAKAHYTTQTKTVPIGTDFTTTANFALAAGQITVTPTSIAKSVSWGGQATQKLTFKNTGTSPATVTIGEQPGGFQLLAKGALAGTGAPLNRVTGTFTNRSLRTNGKVAQATAKPAADASPADAPWTSIANYPTPIQDNLVGLSGGKVYSAYGYTGTSDTADLYAYDPDAGTWTKLASAADTREKPAGGFIGGKLYAAGGWGADANPDPKLEIYDPATNAWTTGASDPKPYAGSGSAVLGGKLYVVGGCGASSCGSTDVEVYDPASDSWSAAAAYPESTAWESCGGIGGKLYCAGGSTSSATSAHAYVYDPAGNSWSAIANLPIDMWGSASTAANGTLLISGGVTAGSSVVTNQGYAYDPASDSWAALPNANTSLYRSGSTCGFYAVGGNPGGLFVPPVATSEVLPGFADCGGTSDVSWLSESATTLTLAPGKSGSVTVTLDASVAEITQPGDYTAGLTIGTDTPYSATAVGVTMTVKPPSTWGKIAGTVTGPDGTPIAGATVQIDTWATSYTLKTDKNGQYALWLDVRNNPLQVIVAKDGYQPQVKTVKIKKLTTTTVDWSLKKA
jgi:N-acetylneuraminic acid mutarotase